MIKLNLSSRKYANALDQQMFWLYHQYVRNELHKHTFRWSWRSHIRITCDITWNRGLGILSQSRIANNCRMFCVTTKADNMTRWCNQRPPHHKLIALHTSGIWKIASTQRLQWVVHEYLATQSWLHNLLLCRRCILEQSLPKTNKFNIRKKNKQGTNNWIKIRHYMPSSGNLYSSAS